MSIPPEPGRIRCDELLLCSNTGGGRTIYSGSRLRVVDNGEHLTSLHAVSFVSPDLDDVSHHLTREIAGLGSTHGSCSLQEIGNISLLHCEHGNVPDSLWGPRFHWLLSRATAKADHSGYDQGAEF
jgi:hypothetical protein